MLDAGCVAEMFSLGETELRPEATSRSEVINTSAERLLLHTEVLLQQSALVGGDAISS